MVPRNSQDVLSSFAYYGYDIWHCQECHKIVRTYDAQSDYEILEFLKIHLDVDEL